ncbi:AEC family transporter [Sporolactobacillus sp. Y61]|uniref:AEC family transporter n=1 Tax=Sporolactobacillus sp. Y61 TaxID=3160863 RepID=A0AAU8IEI5_9BACL
MSAYLHLLMSTTVPILIICLSGMLLQQRRPVDTKLLADIGLYIFAPALIVKALTDSRLQGRTVLDIFFFTVIMTLVLWILAFLTAKIFKMPNKTAQALTLTTLFSNSNNYGLPVLLLAFGHRGFALGAIYVIGQIILVNILGMYIASRSSMNGKQALIQISKTPLIYAAIAGAALSLLHQPLPIGIDEAAQLLGTAYPALVLLILGVQLRRTHRSGLHRPEVWTGVILRIMAVPLLATVVLKLLGIHGLLASVLLVQVSMPAAINTVLLAEKYDGDTGMISLIVSITTILSFVYLPVLIYFG